MTKMNLGSSDTQASTTASVTSTRIASYESTISALESFVGEGSLKGNAYSSAKTYASSVLIPLLKAAALYSEGVATGTNKIPSEYRNTGSYPTINGESPLDSATLEEELKSLDSTVSSLTTSLQNAKPGSKGYDSVNTQLTKATDRRDKVIKQLAELASYDSASAGFYSDLADLETNLSTGLGQVTSAMSNFKGKFTVPKSKDMAWAKASNKKWDQRAKVIERMNSQQPFDSEFLSEVSDYMGGDYNTEKEILVYDTMYGYAIYKVALNVSKDGKVNLSTEDGKVTGVSSGNASIDIENGKVKGGKVNSKESKSNFGNGFVVGSSSSLALSGTGASNSSTTTVEKNGKKTTVTVENGVKERHGNMAYYNKTTEKTSLDRKIADTDVTSELSTSKELGLYQSYNPTGFAPVTNQVKEFDWGTKVQPAINVAGAAIGAYYDTKAQMGEFIWENKGTIAGIILTGSLGVAAVTVGSPALATAGVVVGLLSILDNGNDKGV